MQDFAAIDNPCEPDEKVEIIIDQVNDLFIQANELIDTIRKQYDIKIASDADFLDVQDDCELCRSILNDEGNGYDEGNHDEYDIVLHEISKKQLIGLQIAFSSLQDYHCSAEKALYQIQLFL